MLESLLLELGGAQYSAHEDGITVANARRAIIFSDGTNIVRATADQA